MRSPRIRFPSVPGFPFTLCYTIIISIDKRIRDSEREASKFASLVGCRADEKSERRRLHDGK